MMKIIAGKYKNRLIPTLKNSDYRPTTSKLKEAIFSILISGHFSKETITNSNILDLFSGSGALAFEALSRGAKTITLVDINSEYLNIARDFAKQIGEEKKINFLNINVLNLPHAYKSFDLVFMDPPYKQNLVAKTIDILFKRGWISSNSILVIEIQKTEEILYPKNVIPIINRSYGKSTLLVLKAL